MTEPLKIYIDPRALTVGDFDQLLMSKYDMFYRRIVEYILKDIEEGVQDDIMAILVDEDGNEYNMMLPKEGYIKSLSKAIEYFMMIEEYETCGLIRDMIKHIEK